MSGIVGIVNLNGAPVDRELLSQMTQFMAFRGPDEQRTWIDGNAGFGHAMLRTTWEAETETQPLTLDGKVWLTADARIDGRVNLQRDLEAKLGRKLRFSAAGKANGKERLPNDAELILLAYEAWGEDCVKHLIGDFAFAIWDSGKQQVFCARDHFGVKPFYYAIKSGCLIFCSSPHPIRLHPAISNNLNDKAIGDFLLFEVNCDLGSSVFADIQRLAPAHQLSATQSSFGVARYWTLPIQEEIRYRKHSEYVEQFSELMRDAVGDRLRFDRASMLLSGGLDSATVAAFSKKLIDAGSRTTDLRAFTYVYDRLMPDPERYYSGLVAQALGIPIYFKASDDYRMYQWPNQSGFRPPEIINEPLRALFSDFQDSVAQHSRVALTGDGGDTLLYPEANFADQALRQMSIPKLVTEIGYCLAAYGRIPRMGFRRKVKQRLGLCRIPSGKPVYPGWFNPSFEDRTSLRDRWEEVNASYEPGQPGRRRALDSLLHPTWPQLFSDHDPETTGSSIEFRYPFFDIRVVNFLLNIPSLPWCFEKGLLRIAVGRYLPEAVRERPKTRIVRDPILVRVEQPEWNLKDYFNPLDRLFDYVDPGKIDKLQWLGQKENIWMHVRPLSLNYWLKSLST